MITPNPFQHASFWYWQDEDGLHHGPYNTQIDALHALMRHIAPPPWYVRLGRELKRMWDDTGG